MVNEILLSLIVLFVGIAVLVLIHVCIGGRVFIGGLNGVTVAESGHIFAKRMMTKEEVQKLPSHAFMADEEAIATSSECAICLDAFRVGEKCRFLPNCSHSFHAQCVDLWLLKTPICPICRASVLPFKIDVNLQKETQFTALEYPVSDSIIV